MNGPVSETQWYIARDGKQHGPLTDIEMRTFVAHSYLRPTDLIWRAGMSEWQPAPTVFPAVFPAAGPSPQTSPPVAQKPAPHEPEAAMAHTSDFDEPDEEDDAPARGIGRQLAIAAVALAILGGGAFALVNYQEPLMALVSGTKSTADTQTAESKPAVTVSTLPPDSAPPVETQATPAKPDPATTDAPAAATGQQETQTAAIAPTPPPAPPPPVDGSDIDVRLQKIPVWALLKSDYHDWYETTVGEAVKMELDNRPESDVAMHLAEGLVALRRQNAEKALAASPDKLHDMAAAFLANLQALQTQGVSACYGFISKGETSPAIVQLMQNPETATAFNAHVKAIFDAIKEGEKSPTQHEAAVKGDYDILIRELGKIGWKEDDLKTFSNPRLLAKQQPEQVCKMVIDWFVAHLAVKDKSVQERLLYETLKPVVTG
jgi:hypothetical protein